jgi:hypothetical protein
MEEILADDYDLESPVKQKLNIDFEKSDLNIENEQEMEGFNIILTISKIPMISTWRLEILQLCFQNKTKVF